MYWNVMSSLFGENKTVLFSDVPYYVAWSPCTSIGLPYLQVLDFLMFIRTVLDSKTSDPYSQQQEIVSLDQFT
jgi:hypothetical protein